MQCKINFPIIRNIEPSFLKYLKILIMKKNILIAIILGISPMSTFAQIPLNETFESFNVSTAPVTDITTPYYWGGQGSTLQIVDNPTKTGINTSSKVLQINRIPMDTITTNSGASNFVYRGVQTTAYDLALTATNCVIELKVLKAVDGIVGIRIYPNKNITTVYTIVTANLQGSPDWQTVRFDFSAIVAAMTTTPIFKFEMEKTTTVAGQKPALTVLIDDVRVVEKTAIVLSPLNETFENFTISAAPATTVVSSSFSWSSVETSMQIVANPNKTGINTSNKAMQLSRIATSIATDIAASGLTYKGVMTSSYGLPMTSSHCIIEAKVLKTVAGKVGIRILPNTTASAYTIIMVDLPGSPDWQKVQFDCSAIASTMTTTPQFRFEIEKTPSILKQQDALTVLIDDIKLIDNSSSAVNDINGERQINTFIDPANSMLKLQNLPNENCTIQLTNLSGIECLKVKTNTTSPSIDVSTLNTGIYLVSCYTAQGKVYTGKVIKR